MASDTPENLENLMSGTGHVALETKASKEQMEVVLKSVPEISSIKYEETDEHTTLAYIESKDGTDLREKLFYTFADARIPLLTLRLNKSSLEDIFLELTQGGKKQKEAEKKLAGKEEQKK